MYFIIIFTNRIEDNRQAQDEYKNNLHLPKLEKKIIQGIMDNFNKNVTDKYSSASLVYTYIL